MVQKAYFVLLCAFLASTCINGKPVREEPKDCPDKDKLLIRGNSTTQRLGIFNESCNAGLIIDVEGDTAILVNGDEGTAVVIDLKTNETKIVFNGICDPESLLDSCSDLDGDETGNSCNPSDEVLDLVQSIFDCLFKVDKDKVDPEESLEVIIEISANLAELLQGDLKGIIELTEDGITVRQDVAKIYIIMQGLATILSNIPGGLECLEEKGVSIDLQEIFDAENGVDALAIILQELGCEVDVGETLGSLLNDPASLLVLLGQLGGREDTGVNGLLRVLSAVACYLKEDVKLEVIINVIINVLAESRDEGCNENLKDELNESLKNLLSVLDQLKGSDCLSGLESTIQDLLDETLELDGVDLSAILEDVLDGITDDCSNPLTVLVEIILELTKSCEGESKEEAILSILLVLILDVNNPLYAELLQKLGIDIDTQECGPNSSPSECDSNEDLYDILLSLPGIKEVTESLKDAVSEATDGEIDLEELVNNDDINESIKAALQLEGYVDFGLCEDDLDEVREIIDKAVSLRLYLGIPLCPNE